MPVFRLPDRLEPASLLEAYAIGIFPMADQWGNLSWYSPDPRAVLEHENMHISRTLRARLRQGRYEIRFDTAFEQVMRACAAPRSGESGTWIDQSFVRVYTKLHHFGFAHSAEAWEDGDLVGGLYGVSIGAAFMGESMFSRRADASKVCLAALVDRLRACGYVLHDTQFLTPHLATMGAHEIPREVYVRRLARAIAMPCHFDRHADGSTVHELGART
jgi:leucyl/phenylalanyl-tRNA---protein transferase